MQLTPDIKAQLAEQKKQCVYCKIVAKEIPPKIVFEDSVTLGILDIYPAKKGHTVLALKEHYPIVPLIPAAEFAHFFGLVPTFSAAIKSAMVATGINLFIASGGAAGQQFPHFLGHFLPRENGDNFFHFVFKSGKQLSPDKLPIIQGKILQLLQGYFTKNPQSWHHGAGAIPSHLQSIAQKQAILYEDERVLCVVAERSVVPGHLEVYSKTEEKDISKLSQDESVHLFFVASFATSALFEGLAAHGTNILLKSGFSDDNPSGRLCVHVLPRFQGDSLQAMMWQPKQPEYNLDDLVHKVKDKMWKVKYQEPQRESPFTKPVAPPVVKIGGELKPFRSPVEEEIEDAIQRVVR